MDFNHPWAGRSTEQVGPDPRYYDADRRPTRLSLSQARYLANLRRPKNGRTRRLLPDWKLCRTCGREFHRVFNSKRIYCESCRDGRNLASNKAMYQRRRAARLCVRCGLAADGRATCRPCQTLADQQRDPANQRLRMKVLRAKRLALGLCTRCETPSENPRCEDCLADERPGSRMRKRRRDAARKQKRVADSAYSADSAGCGVDTGTPRHVAYKKRATARNRDPDLG